MVKFNEEQIEKLSLEKNKRFYGEISLQDEGQKLEIKRLYKSLKDNGVTTHENIVIRKAEDAVFYVVEGNTRVALIKVLIKIKNNQKTNDFERYGLDDKLEQEIKSDNCYNEIIREFVEKIYYREIKTDEEEKKLLEVLINNKKLPFSKLSDALILAPELKDKVDLNSKRYLAILDLISPQIVDKTNKYKKFINEPGVFINVLATKKLSEYKKNLYQVLGLNIGYYNEEPYFKFEGKEEQINKYRDILNKSLDLYIKNEFENNKNTTPEEILSLINISIKNEEVIDGVKGEEEYKLKNIKECYFIPKNNDFNFKEEIKKQINNCDEKNLRIEYPKGIMLIKSGWISGRNSSGEYNGIVIHYFDQTKSTSLVIKEIADTVKPKSNNRRDKIIELKKIYDENFSQYKKIIHYLEFLKNNLDNDTSPIITLVIQSFLEMNFKLFLRELNGISISEINPKDRSGNKIEFDETLKYDINDYIKILKILLIESSERDNFKNFYIKLNAFKHDLDEPISDQILADYFRYCQNIVEILLDAIIENNEKSC